jgi:hypothetical protein
MASRVPTCRLATFFRMIPICYKVGADAVAGAGGGPKYIFFMQTAPSCAEKICDFNSICSARGA